MSRERVVLAAEGHNSTPAIVGPDDLATLLEALDPYGPETVGFVVELEEGFERYLPPAWTAEEIPTPGGSA